MMINVVQAFDRAPIAELESDDAAALEARSRRPEGCSPIAVLGSKPTRGSQFFESWRG